MYMFISVSILAQVGYDFNCCMLGGVPLSGLCPGRHGGFAMQIFVAVVFVVASLLNMPDNYELDVEENLDAGLELQR